MITLRFRTDFLALEALLMLFARLLPSTNSKSESGQEKRTQFISDVIDSTSLEGTAHAKEIVPVLESVSSNTWEEVSAKILDIFSRSNISLYVAHRPLNVLLNIVPS